MNKKTEKTIKNKQNGQKMRGYIKQSRINLTKGG
jgi:hypothetical protein